MVKMWTRGDALRCRDLYKGARDVKEVCQQAKPVIQCNSLPNIYDLSHGLRRRLNAIPFQTVFTDNPILEHHRKANNNN